MILLQQVHHTEPQLRVAARKSISDEYIVLPKILIAQSWNVAAIFPAIPNGLPLREYADAVVEIRRECDLVQSSALVGFEVREARRPVGNLREALDEVCFAEPIASGDGKVFADQLRRVRRKVLFLELQMIARAGRRIRRLGVYQYDWSSIAWSINDLGHVAGESHPPFGSRPVVWNNDAAHTAIELPLLPGDNYGAAQKINNLGHVLGYSAYGIPGTWDIGPGRIVLWRDGGVYELQALLDPVTGQGWSIINAAAINNLGQIAGLAVKNGMNRAVLLTPLH